MSVSSATTPALRRAIENLPDVAAQENLSPPKRGELYLPKSHMRALSLDTTVVVGMRGAGKSVWTAALFDKGARQRLVDEGASRQLAATRVFIGFGNDPYHGEHPDSETLQHLLGKGIEARYIWRGVFARKCAGFLDSPLPADNYEALAVWSREQPEAYSELLGKAAAALEQQGETMLLVFDSLDTTASGSWEQVRALTRGALEVALACRPYSQLRFKFFLRPDMKEDDNIFDFRDSSKLLHNRVELAWRPVDLYALLFHILANGEEREAFRRLGNQGKDLHWPAEGPFSRLPDAVRSDESSQRPLWEALAGRYMGTNRRRGYTYTWLTGHLADAHGRIAPRSLLLALRKAAEITAEKYPDYETALHYEAIKRGVAEASDTRVHELSREDYPWVEPLLKELRNCAVPIEIEELRQKWTSAVLDKVLLVSGKKLPPRGFALASPAQRDVELLVDDLEELGVLYRTEDKRINIPDIFRVGFGIRRKGGVRPPRPGH